MKAKRDGLVYAAAAGVAIGFFVGEFVVGAQHEHGDLGLHPDGGFLEVFGGHVLKSLPEGGGGHEAAFFSGVELVGGAVDALGGGHGALVFGDLEDPADEFLIVGQAVFGVGNEDAPLFFDRRDFLFVHGGLDGLNHLFDDLAEDFRRDLVSF